ncbi:PilC/PilY family type IV pilus protein [Pseudoduganella namucuonensis]|uniref:Type IV pilus assembly protein PilY1 n=1 Tax=Pseudoduganella namucuonensis TaxID=1035707 RepID=A0A1I7HS85_9BURK|nr:PilC/PilY family type IV pilus protein [Pseudoduganella namucuonensis]SFU63316.1 type IV pilus assembly protein PilY1 [Pseudoduganella namucuonensis]
MNRKLATLASPAAPLFALLALAAALLPPAALAATTNIAQVPLLNITGTGTVKPNLMLLFDNSGSMEQHYTPDHVNDNLCRSSAKLSNGVTSCNVGHPPFMSPDFNRQIYNPKIRYQPPIKADGTYYAEQTATATSNWTSVASDGFGVFNKDLYGASDTTINLTNGFPDLKWCDPSNTTDCRFNTATYTYPDNTYRTATAITTGPYYYNIAVAEYCTDDTMTVCKSTAAGAAAPAGYPVPVKVRWCTTTALVTCQAKRVGSYIYPRYSTASGAVASYGTITIGASGSSSSLNITSVTIPDPSTQRTITNGTVTASSGTNTALKQQTLASALAASIIAKTGLTNQYYACVKTPIGQPTVPACSTFGITLASESVVAVVPVLCSGAKSTTNCLTINDNSRSGWGITVNVNTVTATPATTGQPPTALLSVTGTTANSGTPALSYVRLAGTTIASNIGLTRNVGATTVVSKIVAAINANAATSATIKAYTGGNNITGYCAQQPSTTVCIVNSTVTSNTGTVTTGTLTNGGSVAFTTVSGTSITDTIPATTAALSSGSEAPSTFVRVNIVSGTTYPKAADRVDCVATAGVCTYTEEMTNFANWYTYYKSRLQMMKTSVGIAFAAINANYRVGYVKLSAAGAAGAIDMKPADFTGTSRTNWYSTLYNTTTSGSTPIRTAMDNVGRMYANLTPYNYAAGQEVVQYPCQPNFLILTTDGYWNGSSTNNVVNNDNVESSDRFCTQSRGCVDPRAQTQPSISDVALHWYNGGSSTGTVSLRPSLEPDMTKPGSVPAAAGENTHLHMNTYTLGLGMDGVMTYEANYDTAPKVGGDFYNLITGVTSGCPWNGGGAYVWPDPQTTSTASTVQERVDDLWHAAINGHGKYFSANEPKEVVEGLASALANMQVSVGAAAAAATSTPNISQQDNDIFSDTFTTVKWYGELSDKKIDPATGIVGTTAVWVSSDTVGLKVADDSRTIYMQDTATTGAKKEFKYAAMNATEKAWFANKCTSLSQCTLLSSSDRDIVNNGTHMVNWLRGVQTYANDEIFRAYTMTTNTPSGAAGPIPIVLGDIASSKPAYMRDPRKSYTTTGYDQFKTDNATRAGTVFTAANDGMLHAFDAATGEELWAYVPRITMKKLYNLSSTTYGTNHIFTTDGSPELGDVQIGGVWKTVLVAGLNGGGRGFYALDVTDPANPVVLWELCADSTVCALNDPDIGLTFGNAQYGMWRGQWVVFLTSGYNNVPGTDGVATGNGQGTLYIVNVATGAILKKVSTLAGDTTTPSGLAKITAISADPATDPVVTYIYGGDNQGQLWRFDLTDTATTNVGLLKLGDTGALQPITTRPDVTLCQAADASGTLYAQRVVLFGTGRLLDVPDTANTDVQSLYLVKDVNAAVSVRGAGMVRQTLSLQGSSSNVNTYTITTNDVDLNTQSGWYFDWTLNAGERMNLDPKIVSGVANVVTNMPTSSSACSVGGSSNVYGLDVCTGTPPTGTVAGTTLSNTSAAVGFIIIRLPKGELKMIVTTAKGETLTKPLTELNSANAHKVGWRRVKTD